MIEELRIHGFKTLIDTSIVFNPLTIMLGKNGAGKSAILDCLQVIGNFSRGGADRAFGPPPWSLGWLRTRGIGTVPSVRFSVVVKAASGERYKYSLSLDEYRQQVKVNEERLIRLRDQRTIASLNKRSPPSTGTILKPDYDNHAQDEITEVSEALKSIVCYELNPEVIEQGVDAEHTYVGRDGYGVAGFLANLKDKSPERFGKLEAQLKKIRPETKSIDVWSSGGKVFWGLRDPDQERAFPAVHLSWGDRQLIGLLCVLHAARPAGAMVAIEEIDRGLHHSRYLDILEILSEAAYDGLDGCEPVQIVITTHSPSFVNQFQDRVDEIRSVIRFSGGGTLVKPLGDLLRERLGTLELTAPIGEIWETGVLEDLAMNAR